MCALQAGMSRMLPGPVWSSERDCGWIDPLRGQRRGYYHYGGFITGTGGMAAGCIYLSSAMPDKVRQSTGSFVTQHIVLVTAAPPSHHTLTACMFSDRVHIQVIQHGSHPARLHVLEYPLHRQPRADHDQGHAVAWPCRGTGKVEPADVAVTRCRPHDRQLVQPVGEPEGGAVLHSVPADNFRMGGV